MTMCCPDNVLMQLDSKPASQMSHTQQPRGLDFGDRNTFSIPPPSACGSLSLVSVLSVSLTAVLLSQYYPECKPFSRR